jgi:TrpR-related protein YerC/YecD
MEKWNNRKTEDLGKAFLALETAREAKLFLRDLLTEKELLELGNRWKAVRMLDEGISYSKIIEETGLSSTTVARISMWLKEGTGGYRLMLDRISNNHHRTLSHPRKR